MRHVFLAEALGTFTLVFCGCAAIVVDQQFGGLGHLGICLVFGLVVMALIYAIGNISGAHMNPAVTLGFLAAGRIQWKTALPYIVCQFLGAIAAGLLLWVLFESEHFGSTIPNISIGRAFLAEVIFTFFLMFVILNVSTGHMEKGVMAGVAVGGTVMIGALIAGPLTGGSMNPARSLGPALVAGEFKDLWLYFAAPVLGALMAYPTCKWVQGPDCCTPESQ